MHRTVACQVRWLTIIHSQNTHALIAKERWLFCHSEKISCGAAMTAMTSLLKSQRAIEFVCPKIAWALLITNEYEQWAMGISNCFAMSNCVTDETVKFFINLVSYWNDSVIICPGTRCFDGHMLLRRSLSMMKIVSGAFATQVNITQRVSPQ